MPVSQILSTHCNWIHSLTSLMLLLLQSLGFLCLVSILSDRSKMSLLPVSNLVCYGVRLECYFACFMGRQNIGLYTVENTGNIYADKVISMHTEFLFF